MSLLAELTDDDDDRLSSKYQLSFSLFAEAYVYIRRRGSLSCRIPFSDFPEKRERGKGEGGVSEKERGERESKGDALKKRQRSNNNSNKSTKISRPKVATVCYHIAATTTATAAQSTKKGPNGTDSGVIGSRTCNISRTSIEDYTKLACSLSHTHTARH